MSRKTVVCYSSILRSCITGWGVHQAKQTHARIIVTCLSRDVALQTDIILAYSQFGFLKDARKVFDRMHKRNMHSWNILLSSYVRNSLFVQAIHVFSYFLSTRLLSPDHYTLPPMFKTCAELEDKFLGQMLHSLAIRFGYMENIIMCSSIINFYLKLREVRDARNVFSSMSCRDQGVWNSMISGLFGAGFHEDAKHLLGCMVGGGLVMDSFLVTSLLNVCGKEGDLARGTKIHGQLVTTGTLDADVAIGNSLIDMYAKCGCLNISKKVFDSMSCLNLITWTTMISCLGVHGEGEECLNLFSRMRDQGFNPNPVTLTAVLSACSHSGLVDEGQRIFSTLQLQYGFEPTAEHHACMVDLLGRAGHLDKALILVLSLGQTATASAWGALLAGCVIHNNMEIGELAAHHLFEMEPTNPTNYLSLCSIYKACGANDRLAITKAMMRNASLSKEPACSGISIANVLCKFYKGDVSNILVTDVCEALGQTIKLAEFF